VKPKGSKARIELLGDYDPQNIKIIEDPYYVGHFCDNIILYRSYPVAYFTTFHHH